MRAGRASLCVVAGLLAAALAGSAVAADYPETVVVGNPGNAADTTGFGAVAYTYRIGKYEVTNDEYCEFLNAVGKSGTGEKLWRWQMGQKENGGIVRSGAAGEYAYTVKPGMGRKPAVLMNWHETLHFCNWLSNGKGSGSVDVGPYVFTNEWGSLTVKMPDHAALAADTKKASWVLASEDEWYKAAYYDPEKPGGAGYWWYPAKGDAVPDANLSSGMAKDVGSFKDVASAYGTFDQGGNAWEWNETQAGGNCGVRGGSYWINDHAGYMLSSTRYCSNPVWFVFDNYGFRVAALGGEPTAKE